MRFFKHFTNGHDSYAMTELMNRFGVEGYGAYFILIEMCAEKMDKERSEEFTKEHCKFRFHERQVREKLRMRSTKVELFLNYSSTLDLLQFTKVGDEFHFCIPKLLEYLDRDSKRARTVRDTSAPRARLDIEEDKDKEEDIRKPRPETRKARSVPTSVSDYMALIKPEALKAWFELYGDMAWVDSEIKNAICWCISNSHKAPKSNFTAFYNNWLKRSWESHRKSKAANPHGQNSKENAVPLFETEAGYILQAVTSYGLPNASEAKEFLGDQRWHWVQCLGGWRAVCEMKRDTWTIQRIIKVIKEQTQGVA